MLVKDNKYIPEEDKDLFILLRIGLWQRVDEVLSCSPDWNYIYTLACEQTVQGLIAEGIGIYRKEHPNLNITQEQNDNFLSASAQIIRRNHALNMVQTKLCKLFKAQNITYVVLKGQVVGQCYPKPNLRCSGDIDFLIPSEGVDDYERAKELLSKLSSTQARYNPREKHLLLTIEEIPVEIHGTARSYISEKLDYIIEQERRDMFAKQKYLTTNIIGSEVSIPSIEYHSLFFVCHILKHIFNEGIGLRQFCDFAVFLSAKYSDINYEKVHELIQKADIQRHWNLISYFITLFLCPEFKDPCYKASKYNRLQYLGYRIWLDCKESGNFGHADDEEKTEAYKNFWSRNRHRIKTANSLFRQQFKYSPTLAIGKITTFYMGLINILITRTFEKVKRL